MKISFNGASLLPLIASIAASVRHHEPRHVKIPIARSMGRVVWSGGTAVRGDRINDLGTLYVSMRSAHMYHGTQVFRKPKERKPKQFVGRTSHLRLNHPARSAR